MEKIESVADVIMYKDKIIIKVLLIKGSLRRCVRENKENAKIKIT